MLAMIRRALDAKRLTGELEAAEREIASLKAELSSRLIGPSWREVAKDFDASHLHDDVIRKVIDDLAPALEHDAIQFLKHAAAGFQREYRNTARMTGAVAYDMTANVYEFEFRTRAMGTRVKSMNF